MNQQHVSSHIFNNCGPCINNKVIFLLAPFDDSPMEGRNLNDGKLQL